MADIFDIYQIQKLFPGLLNICAKFEEIPSTSKDVIGRQTCGAGGYGGASGPFRQNSSHKQTSVPHRTLNTLQLEKYSCTNRIKSKLVFYIPSNSQGQPGTDPQHFHLWEYESNPDRGDSQ